MSGGWLTGPAIMDDFLVGRVKESGAERECDGNDGTNFHGVSGVEAPADDRQIALR